MLKVVRRGQGVSLVTDIGPGWKRPAGPHDDHGTHIRVSRDGVYGRAQPVDHGVTEGIHWRVVDADERDAIDVGNTHWIHCSSS